MHVICCSFISNISLILFCDCRCTRCWMNNSANALGQYLRQLFYCTYPLQKQNPNEQARPYYVLLFLGIKNDVILAIGTFTMSRPDLNGRKCLTPHAKCSLTTHAKCLTGFGTTQLRHSTIPKDSMRFAKAQNLWFRRTSGRVSSMTGASGTWKQLLEW